MATFYCTNCDTRMCNSSDMNTFEHFLIKTNVYNLKQKQYDKIVSQSNKETEEWNAEYPDDKKEMDTWFDVCIELGQWAWICPKCKTLHVFKLGSNKLETVYKPDHSWKKKNKQ